MPDPLYKYILNMICKHIMLITFLDKPNLILLHTVKWLQVYLCISNNLIKHQSFVYIQLNDQTVLFSISHLFALSLNVKQFYLTHRSNPLRCYNFEPKSNERVLSIPQSSRITRASPSDCLISHPGHSL